MDEMITRVRAPWLACLIVLLWIFGKRISEVITLRRRDIVPTEDWLYVRFSVLKKQKINKKGVPVPYTKKIRADHRYVKYILAYVRHFDAHPDGYIFPSNRSRSGHITRQHAHNHLKKVNVQAWLHLFRHSLATIMAEDGATAFELMQWFDWSRLETAVGYVRRSGKLSERLSRHDY